MKHRMVSLRRISVTTLSPLDPDSAQKNTHYFQRYIYTLEPSQTSTMELFVKIIFS